MPTWPASLPQSLKVEGLSRQRQDGAIRFQPDAGVPITRRRGTGVTINIGGILVLSSAQLQTLDTFYNTTLVEGVASFTWVDPVDNSSAVMVFQGPFSVVAMSPGHWRIALQLQILP